MANYEGYMRTNYFKVNDVEKFKQIASDLGLDYWEDEERGFAFSTDDNFNTDQDLEGNEYDTVKKLQEILVDDGVIVITEVGHEKLRYLCGFSTIITKKEIACVDLMQEIILKACALSGKSEEDIVEGMYY